MQGVLEDALSRFVGQEVPTTVAGRTDRGVHAHRNVVHADVPARVDENRLRAALDRMCGDAITIWRVRTVPASFDARFSASRRRYAYRLCDAEAMDPTWRHVTWHVGRALDQRLMESEGQVLVGEHDFTSFCRRSGDRHLRRRIDVLAVRRRARGLLVVRIEGKAFCQQMVRSITGCLVAVGSGQRGPGWLAGVLSARDRQTAAAVAPPHGLTLVGVSYTKDAAGPR